jgi:hypothetical protein
MSTHVRIVTSGSRTGTHSSSFVWPIAMAPMRVRMNDPRWLNADQGLGSSSTARPRDRRCWKVKGRRPHNSSCRHGKTERFLADGWVRCHVRAITSCRNLIHCSDRSGPMELALVAGVTSFDIPILTSRSWVALMGSQCWSCDGRLQLQRQRSAWRAHLRQLLARFASLQSLIRGRLTAAP